MRSLILVVVLGVLIAACGGADDSGGDGATDSVGTGSSDVPDPCTLAPESVLASYFGESVVEGEPGGVGPIDSCSWTDAKANSLLIQVASDHQLFRPDPCTDCVDLSFGDDGFASGSGFQSTAKLVSGSLWYSVTTTGFGDNVDSIAALAKTLFEDLAG
jgi:hypothetical protein